MSNYYDLHVNSSLSIGESSPEELIDFAKKLGYSGIAICDHYNGMEKLKKNLSVLNKLKKENEDFEVATGVEIVAKNPAELRRIVNLVREKVAIVVVYGGDYKINRAACENPKVDILAHPEFERKDNGLDAYCIKQASKNSVLIEVNFKEMLQSHKKSRIFVMTRIAENIRLCKRLGANMVICSGAESKWEMRNPRALASISNILGMELSAAINSISIVPENTLKRNYDKLSGKVVFNGVEVAD